MGFWYPNWYPKNSGCLAGTQRMGAVRTVVFRDRTGGLLLGTSKAVYGPFTTIFPRRLGSATRVVVMEVQAGGL